jgi:transcriptional regulator with XRE-family HTH domain
VSKKSPNPIDKHVGARVRLRRTPVGMSQERLGDALGLTFQQVQKYEKGTNRIGASRLHDIAAVLGVEVEFFFQGLEARPDADPARASMNAFMALPESNRLMQNFVRLQDEEARRRVTDLIEWLASTSTAGAAERRARPAARSGAGSK